MRAQFGGAIRDKNTYTGAWAGAGRSIPDLGKLITIGHPVLQIEAAVALLNRREPLMSKMNRGLDSYKGKISSSVADVTQTDANSENFKNGQILGETFAPAPPVAKGVSVISKATKAVRPWQNIKVTDSAIDIVEAHFKNLGPQAMNDPTQVAALKRLRKIASGELKATDHDLRFLSHETLEAKYYKGKTGDPEVDQQRYMEAHDRALEEDGLNRYDYEDQIYHPDTIDLDDTTGSTPR